MAPAYAVLDVDVRLVAKPLESVEEGGVGGSSKPIYEALRWALASDSEGDEDDYEPTGVVDWVRRGTVSLVADNPAAGPPAICTLSLHLPATPREIEGHLGSVRVISADKNLLVLSTGPRFYYAASSGHYLVYDAAADGLIAAPPINWYEFREIFGRGPVVVHRGGGDHGSSDFILAELVLSRRTERHSVLLWSHASTASAGGQGQWARHDVRLPRDVEGHAFFTDVAFAFQGRWACWVDLSLGILMCDVLSPEPGLLLVPLPEDYQKHSFVRGRRTMYCTVGCTAGVIKFLYMDGYTDDDDDDCRSWDQVTIATWTLQELPAQDPSRWQWRKDDDRELRVGDLWADESFLAIPGLPRRAPMCPVLSPKELDTVYFGPVRFQAGVDLR
ncbi:hypothetical protein ACP70R_012794 [Stipagrostis hirtigluma subsp. patula]